MSGWVVALAFLQEEPGTGEKGGFHECDVCVLFLSEKAGAWGCDGRSDVTSACDGRDLVVMTRRLCETWTGKSAEISFRSCLVVCITEFLRAWLSVATGTREW